MIFSPSEVLPIATSTGFRAEMIEKVLHLRCWHVVKPGICSIVTEFSR